MKISQGANELILTGWEFQYYVIFVRTEAENVLDTPQGPFSVTWANFNPSMDKWLQTRLSLSENTYPFPNFNGSEWMSD